MCAISSRSGIISVTVRRWPIEDGDMREMVSDAYKRRHFTMGLVYSCALYVLQ